MKFSALIYVHYYNPNAIWLARLSFRHSAPSGRLGIMWSPKIDLKQSCMRWKLSHFTYRRSAFLGIPFGTVFKARPWQSTCDPEQLHLCGHPLTEAAHTRSAETRANPRQSAACLPGPLGGMVSSSNYFQSESDWKDVAVSSAKRDGSRDPDTGQRMPLKLVGGERSKKKLSKVGV